MEQHKMADLKITSSPSITNTESAAPPTISQPSTSSTEAATTEFLSIRTIESSLPPLRGANASFADHVECSKAYKYHLDKFYNGQRFRFKKYKRMSKKARQREFERLTDSLLRMVGGSIGEKKKEDAKIVIGIGMGRFTSTSRLSSLHGTFESYFIQKARSLGYLVVGVHEFYTSKKCPTCGNFVGQAESIWRLYCYHCKKYMHRDVMAGHNIVNIVRSHVEQQERPLYLHPVDKDGHYPWLEHGCETAAQPRDAPSSLKQASSSGGRAGRAGRKRRAEADGNAERGGKRTKATMAKGKGKATTTKDKANAMQVDS
ncbi:hypothetical protein K457DRAFT_706861 [Linnemannia elongata AG-77]|uniref:Cas12f1-like TNB domain-containing protein n=1 Tax=Linnemannia elongata AG-77 TaxID=1314771 RepID=A0A197JP67_9FUNG|nr:hypothetical protein K457DRAFT_706861 [Linnemannia elongata AG-77]